MSRKNKYLIAYFVIIALMCCLPLIMLCNQLSPKYDTIENWVFIGLGVLAGIGFFISQELWAEIKEERKKKK